VACVINLRLRGLRSHLKGTVTRAETGTTRARLAKNRIRRWRWRAPFVLWWGSNPVAICPTRPTAATDTQPNATSYPSCFFCRRLQSPSRTPQSLCCQPARARVHARRVSHVQSHQHAARSYYPPLVGIAAKASRHRSHTPALYLYVRTSEEDGENHGGENCFVALRGV
jgi:hypothetical protein